MGIPVVLLEQNIVPGRATAWLSRLAERVCTSFEDTRGHLPRRAECVLTGNPIRAEIAALHALPREPAAQPVLLVLGGSQGAHSLNGLITDFVSAHAAALEGWSVFHQTGPADHSAVAARYAAASVQAVATPFIDDMAAAYRSATLAVSRAGATTIAELACCGAPAVLLPHRQAIRDHQHRNAEFFAEHGAAIVVRESGTPAIDAQRLQEALLRLMSSPALLGAMSTAMRKLAHPRAAKSVCNVIQSLTPVP